LSTQLEKECCDLLEQCCCQFQGKTSIYLWLLSLFHYSIHLRLTL
jgi:hypothetical protein